MQHEEQLATPFSDAEPSHADQPSEEAAEQTVRVDPDMANPSIPAASARMAAAQLLTERAQSGGDQNLSAPVGEANEPFQVIRDNVSFL